MLTLPKRGISQYYVILVFWGLVKLFVLNGDFGFDSDTASNSLLLLNISEMHVPKISSPGGDTVLWKSKQWHSYLVIKVEVR